VIGLGLGLRLGLEDKDNKTVRLNFEIMMKHYHGNDRSLIKDPHQLIHYLTLTLTPNLDS
jgi:hypothetical protein